MIRQRRFVTLSSFHHLFFRSQLNADTKPHILTRNWRDSETKLADKTGEKKEIDLGDMRRQSLLPNVSVTHFYPLSSFSPLGYCNTFQSLDRDEWLCLSTQSTLTCLSFSISVCLLVFLLLNCPSFCPYVFYVIMSLNKHIRVHSGNEEGGMFNNYYFDNSFWLSLNWFWILFNFSRLSKVRLG